jgi:hypothetical protein
MKIQKYIVQIESAADTRWIRDPQDFENLMQLRLDALTTAATMGTAPSVTVIREETQSGE